MLGTPSFGVRSPARTRHVTLGVKTWLATLGVSLAGRGNSVVGAPLRLPHIACVFLMRHYAVGPFYLVSMPGEVKDPTQGVNV